MLLDRMNQTFSQSLQPPPAAPGGGGASLTPLGAEVLERYQQVATQVAEAAHERCRRTVRK
jgi:molybdenum-dependent DNA-binding transcriptional regulator ModE